MAVKGRLRFEILRRDNHQCRYCGGTAPDVKLTVDHVVPESLGGSDDPTNLVTACTSCNAGKASIAPDSALVDDVAADALRYSAALTAAITERYRNFSEMQDRIDEFDDAWSRWGSGEDRQKVARSHDWRNTVERWLIGGLTVDELASKIPLAMSQRVKNDGRWAYFCGIGWGMLTDLQERARSLAGLVGTGEDGEPDLGDLAVVGWVCEECTAYDLPTFCSSCSYGHGWDDGLARSLQVADEDSAVNLWIAKINGAVLI